MPAVHRKAASAGDYACVCHSQATPYRPIIDLLKVYFQLDAGDDLQTIRDKVTDKLLALERTLQPILPALLVLLEVPVDDSQWQALNPVQRRQRIMDAVKYVLLRESHIQPLCLVVENLHWIDAETQGFLDALVESLPTARVLLLVSYRPEYRHDWGSKTYYTQLRLDPLPPESAAALLRALLGNGGRAHSPASLPDLTQRLIERTEGNPFFLEESVRNLVEAHILTGEPGAYRLAQPVSHLQVPATVQAVLAARIDRLPAEDKRLLQTAAVIGQEVPFSLLQIIVGLPSAALRQGLAHLQKAEFIYEHGLLIDLAYTFKHALTHEVAYESLQQERRRSLHAGIVNALETLYAGRLAEQVERLAHHALRGEVWDKALVYSRQAGAKAGAHSAYREAITRFERALEVLTHLPESRNTLEQAFELRLDLRTALQPLGDIRRIYDLLHDAVIIAEALDDQRRIGRVSRYMCTSSRQMGDYEAAIALAQRALAISIALRDVLLHFNANVEMARTYHALGGYSRAIACLRTNVVGLERALSPRPRIATPNTTVTSRIWLTQCLAELGAFAEGITHGEEGIQKAEALDHPFSRAYAYGGVGYLYLRKGDLRQAIVMLERGVDLCQVYQIRRLFPSVASVLGPAYALSGRVADALPLLEQAVEQAACMRFVPLVSSSLAAHRDPPDVETAAAYYRQALALAEALGMRPLTAHCHRGLGAPYAKIGRRERARTELGTAVELYRAMDMTFWLPQMEAALAHLA